MYMNTFIARAAALLFVTIIAGCGFQMRGSESGNKPEHLKSIYVTGPGQYSNFTRDLKVKLISQGISVVDNAQAANLTLNLIDTNDERRTLTITRSDRTDEYQLISTAKFKVTTPAGSEVISEKSIIAERVYLYNRDKIIGTEYERDMLIKEMHQDIIGQIITRLYAITQEDIANASKPSETPKTNTKEKDKPGSHDVLDQQNVN